MKRVKQYIFLLIVILLTTSFVHKDLNEYGKWLKFYNLIDEDFKQVGVDIQIKLEYKPFDMTTEDKKLYDSLFFYSPDLTYFLDLYSYGIIIDKDSKGNLTLGGGDPESKVQLVIKKKLSAATLLFFGTSGFTETAIWRNKFLFEIMGFQISNGKYIPTIWKFDLEKMVYKVFESKKTFNKRPNSYLIENRFKAIKEK
jgi:hypothetical protein